MSEPAPGKASVTRTLVQGARVGVSTGYLGLGVVLLAPVRAWGVPWMAVLWIGMQIGLRSWLLHRYGRAAGLWSRIPGWILLGDDLLALALFATALAIGLFVQVGLSYQLCLVGLALLMGLALPLNSRLESSGQPDPHPGRG